MSGEDEDRDTALRTYIRRVTVEKIDDSGTQQLSRFRGLRGEQLDKVYRPQPFGLSSNPPVDSEGLLLALGGRSDRALLLGGEHKDYRPTGTPSGGTKLYDASGNVISLVQQNVRIVGAAEIRLVAPKIVLESADVNLGGEGGLAVDRTDNNPSTKVKAV